MKCSAASNSQVGVVVQARLGSSRLPGKVLKELYAGQSVLEFLLRRLGGCRQADRIIVATTCSPGDDSLAEWLGNRGIAFVRGEENNCLARYGKAAEAYALGVVVRVTADCPLVVPAVVDEMIEYFQTNCRCIDYLSNRQHANFPEGLDVEVFSREILDQALAEASASAEFEHINYFFLNRPERFRIRYYNHALGADYSRFKLSIDRPEDLERIRRLFSDYRLPGDFSLKQLAAVLIESCKGECA